MSNMIDNMFTILTNIFNDRVNTWYSVTVDISGILGMECKEENTVWVALHFQRLKMGT